jgi:hypothetical protein
LSARPALNDGCTVADQIGQGAGFKHKAVDAKNQRQTHHRQGADR